jgi:hypothetical protein
VMSLLSYRLAQHHIHNLYLLCIQILFSFVFSLYSLYSERK